MDNFNAVLVALVCMSASTSSRTFFGPGSYEPYLDDKLDSWHQDDYDDPADGSDSSKVFTPDFHGSDESFWETEAESGNLKSKNTKYEYVLGQDKSFIHGTYKGNLDHGYHNNHDNYDHHSQNQNDHNDHHHQNDHYYHHSGHHDYYSGHGHYHDDKYSAAHYNSQGTIAKGPVNNEMKINNMKDVKPGEPGSNILLTRIQTSQKVSSQSSQNNQNGSPQSSQNSRNDSSRSSQDNKIGTPQTSEVNQSSKNSQNNPPRTNQANNQSSQNSQNGLPRSQDNKNGSPQNSQNSQNDSPRSSQNKTNGSPQSIEVNQNGPSTNADRVIFPDFLQSFNSSTQRPSPTPNATQPPVVTTARPSQTALRAMLVCLRACPVTSEYNPVCSSSNFTYNNEEVLNCARKCGVNVILASRGPCGRPAEMAKDPVVTTVRSATAKITPTTQNQTPTPTTSSTTQPTRYTDIDILRAFIDNQLKTSTTQIVHAERFK